MAFDVYSPCPCGSGKKLKFCCQSLVSEMDKTQTFLENGQHRMALQALEGLSSTHPDNAWVMTLQASVLIEDEQTIESNRILKKLLETHPDHLWGIGLFALTSLDVHGLDAARPAVYRAFQRCPRAFPSFVFSLASSLARLMAAKRRWMACRAHLTLALRFSPDQERENAFGEMLEFDGDAILPYPFRGVHQLAAYQGDEETVKEAEKGLRLSAIGCWGPAARLYTKLAEKHADDPGLWQNAGLCRAWEGEESLASTALHRAAELHTDFEVAVELETVAQLLDRNNATGDDVIDVTSLRYRVPSLSKLITVFDDQERFVRIPISSADQEDRADGNQPVAEFHILDRPLPPETASNEISSEDLSAVTARVLFYEEDDEEPPSVYLSGLKGDAWDEAERLFVAVADDRIERVEDDEPTTLSTGVKEVAQRDLSWHFPEKTPFVLRRQLLNERWEKILSDEWPNSPLMGLEGRTPLDAVADSDSQIRLTAAVSVFDADTVAEKKYIDLSSVYKMLALAPPKSITLDEQTPLNSLSVMQMLRLPIAELSDAQLKDVYQRAMLVQHPRLMDEILREAASRPTFLEDLGAKTIGVYKMLAVIARDRGRHQEAVEWVQKETAFAKSIDDSFQTVIMGELQELMLRLEDPSDPKLKPLIQKINEQYVPKMPALRERLHQMIDSYGVPTEWLTDSPTEIVSGIASGTPGEQGVWTPGDSENRSGEPEKKLWIPGAE